MKAIYEISIKTLIAPMVTHDTFFKDEELNNLSTVAKFATVQTEGNRKVKRKIDYYNLDMIISVGYRVNHCSDQRSGSIQRLRKLRFHFTAVKNLNNRQLPIIEGFANELIS